MNISAVEYWRPGGDDSYTELSDEPFQEGPTGGRHGHLLTGFELIWFRHKFNFFVCFINGFLQFKHVSLQKYVSFFVGNPVFMNFISQKLISSKNFLEWTKFFLCGKTSEDFVCFDFFY